MAQEQNVTEKERDVLVQCLADAYEALRVIPGAQTTAPPWPGSPTISWRSAVEKKDGTRQSPMDAEKLHELPPRMWSRGGQSDAARAKAGRSGSGAQSGKREPQGRVSPVSKSSA
jgi:hypothetical protein